MELEIKHLEEEDIESSKKINMLKIFIDNNFNFCEMNSELNEISKHKLLNKRIESNLVTRFNDKSSLIDLYDKYKNIEI